MKWADLKRGRIMASLIKFFSTNILLKTFALALTLLIFALAPREEPVIKEIQDVPVRVRVTGQNIIVNDKSAFVRVVLKGQKIDPHLTGNDLRVELDTKDAELSKDEKFFTWTLKKDDVRIPWGLRCESILPATLTLPVDKLGKRVVKIEPVFSGTLPKNLTLGKVTVIPAAVTVDGPFSRLQTIRSIPTLPIQLQGIGNSFDCDQELDRRKYGEFHFTPFKVLVQVEVLPASFDRVFTAVPIRVLTAPGGGKMNFSCRILSGGTVDVTLSAGKETSESLRKEDFFPFVDISGFTRPGRYEMDVRGAFELSDVRVKKVSPQRVSVLLTGIPDEKK